MVVETVGEAVRAGGRVGVKVGMVAIGVGEGLSMAVG